MSEGERNLFTELKRRRVFRVIGMYAVAAFILLQIGDVAFAISASQRLRGVELDEQALGERLGVSYLLDGSVRKAGDDIRIMVQLIRAGDGQQVWSETYQRKVDDVFAIQDLIAEMVARRLKSTLYREGINAIARDRTDNFEAYNHYLTAMYYAPTGRWDLVADYARRATVADPSFQSAHCYSPVPT